MARKSTGKRLRFEVFKRDGFTCRYCGSQPPEVVLVLDHVVPVSEGGESSALNLLTACEACNQGKSDRPLTDVVPRPDAEVLRLEALQEVAELRRYQEAEAARQAAQQEIIETLQDRFVEVGGLDWFPGDALMHQLLGRYPVTIVARALDATALALSRRRVPGWSSGGGQAWIRYLWGCARSMASEADSEEAE